jgi:VanZ family protein
VLGEPRSDSSDDGAPASSVPRLLRITAAIYTLFVLYGCLIPLDFTPVPWERAWATYRHIPELHPIGRFLVMDFTANVLLFVLLAFLWAGSIGVRRKGAGAVAKGVAVWGAAVLFQAALEFAQVYTPPRSVSLWDVIAAACGAAVGVVGWFGLGSKVRRAFERWEATRGRQGIGGWLVTPYSIFLFFYTVLPADLTLNVAALHRKWDRGLIHLVPFTSMGTDPVTAVLGLAAGALLWLPLAALLVLGRGLRPLTAWGLAALFSVGVGALQIVVQSRISDSTDIVCAVAGAGAGVWLGSRLRRVWVMESGGPAGVSR